MSRTSIGQRLRLIEAALARHDPHTMRVARLHGAERAAYDKWRAECDAIRAKYPPGEALFSAILAGEYWPDVPQVLRATLGMRSPVPGSPREQYEAMLKDNRNG